MQLTIKLNGQKLTLEHSLNVAALLKRSSVAAKGIVVELNREIIHKQMYQDTILKDGDEIELIRLVGGG